MPGQSEEAGLLGLVEAEPERRSQRVAARQRARAGFGGGEGGLEQAEQLGATNTHDPSSETPNFYTSQGTTWKYYRILLNTKARSVQNKLTINGAP